MSLARSAEIPATVFACVMSIYDKLRLASLLCQVHHVHHHQLTHVSSASVAKIDRRVFCCGGGGSGGVGLVVHLGHDTDISLVTTHAEVTTPPCFIECYIN